MQSYKIILGLQKNHKGNTPFKPIICIVEIAICHLPSPPLERRMPPLHLPGKPGAHGHNLLAHHDFRISTPPCTGKRNGRPHPVPRRQGGPRLRHTTGKRGTALPPSVYGSAQECTHPTTAIHPDTAPRTGHGSTENPGRKPHPAKAHARFPTGPGDAQGRRAASGKGV